MNHREVRRVYGKSSLIICAQTMSAHVTFPWLIFSLSGYLLCAAATIFHPRGGATKSGSLRQRFVKTWHDASPDRDDAIGLHGLFLILVTLAGILSSADYHRDLAYMALLVFLLHGLLLRITNGFEHATAAALVVFEALVVFLELWAASLH